MVSMARRPTIAQQALRGYIENTRGAALDADRAAHTLLNMIISYVATDSLKEGVALGLVEQLETIRKALGRVFHHSEDSLATLLDDIINRKE